MAQNNLSANILILPTSYSSEFVAREVISLSKTRRRGQRIVDDSGELCSLRGYYLSFIRSRNIIIKRNIRLAFFELLYR